MTPAEAKVLAAEGEALVRGLGGFNIPATTLRLATALRSLADQLEASEATHAAQLAQVRAEAVREAMEYAAKCCEGRALSTGDATARNEAVKCAMAIRYHARNAHLIHALMPLRGEAGEEAR